MIQEYQDLFDRGEYYLLLGGILELQSQNKLKILTKEAVDLLYLKLYSLIQLNFVNEALFESACLLSENELDPLSKLKFFQIQILALTKFGDFSNALKLIQTCDFQLRCLEVQLSAEDEKFIGLYYHTKGTFFYWHGDLNHALTFLKKALTIRENYQQTKQISDTVNNLGQIYCSLGEFELATKCYLECISLDQSLNFEKGVAFSLNNLGFIALQIGELEDAYNYFIEAYNLVKKICHVEEIKDVNKAESKYLDSILIHFEDYNFIGELLSNLANTYYRKDNLRESLNYYKNALYVYQKINNSVLLSDLYTQLISLHLENDNYDLSKHYFNLLNTLKSSGSKTVLVRIKFAKALLYNKEKRLKGKYKAQKLFYRIINEEPIDWNISIKTMTLLSELLFEEFMIFEDPEIITEAKTIIDKMHTIAKDKKSFSLLTETYILKTKIAVIDGELDKAIRYLDQAYLTSSEKNLVMLINKVSSERNKLTGNYQYWKDFLKNSSVKERFEKIEMLDYMNKIKGVIEFRE